MAKPKKQQSEDTQTETTEQEKTFDTATVGHVQLANGDFHMIRIQVNSKTLEVGAVELGKKCRDKLEAKYEFKIEAAKNGLV